MPAPHGTYYAGTGTNAPGAPPLLVPCSGGSHLDWPGSLRRIAGRRVLTIDLPGHGRSPLPGRQSVTAYAFDVIGLFDTLAIPAAVIVGHSLGGAIAQQLALFQPDRVAGL